MPFWLAPPGLAGVAGQALGTGDGSTATFPLVAVDRRLYRPVYGTSGVTAVYLNGVAQGSRLELSSGYLPAVAFASAPAAGVRDLGRLRAALALPLRRRRPGSRGIHGELFELKTLRLTTVRP